MARPRRRTNAAPVAAVDTFRNEALAIGAAALAVRLVYVLSLFGDASFEDLQLNAERYDLWARMILDGRAPTAPFEQAPGYPYFLSFVVALLGDGVRVIAILQAALDAVACALLASIAFRLGGRSAGLATGMLAIASAPLIYFSAEVLPATLFVFCLVLMQAAVLLPYPRRWLGAGSALALAYLVRGEALLAVPVLAYVAFRMDGRRALAAALGPWVCAAVLLIAVNLGGDGPFVWSTTSSGVNLWLGNHAHADGVNPFFGPDQQAMDREVRSQARTAAEASEKFSSAAMRFWSDQPTQALALAWKKLVWTFTHRELPNDVDIERKRASSPLFAVPGLPFGFGLLFVLACVGLSSAASAMGPLRLIVWLPAWVGVITCVVFFTNARFRLPLQPTLLLLAGLGAAHWFERWRRRSVATPELVRAVVIIALASAWTWGNWYGVHAYRIPQIDVNQGVALREAGRFDEAAELLRRGLEREPRDAIAWVHLALALEQAGEIDAARQAYRDGLTRVPGDADLQEMRARFLQRWP